MINVLSASKYRCDVKFTYFKLLSRWEIRRFCTRNGFQWTRRDGVIRSSIRCAKFEDIFVKSFYFFWYHILIVTMVKGIISIRNDDCSMKKKLIHPNHRLCTIWLEYVRNVHHFDYFDNDDQLWFLLPVCFRCECKSLSDNLFFFFSNDAAHGKLFLHVSTK